MQRLQASLDRRLGAALSRWREPLAAALAQAWQMAGEKSRWRVVDAAGGETLCELAADPLRIGNRADCHLRLADDGEPFAVEVRWAEDGAAALRTGGDTRPLAVDEDFELGEHRLTYQGPGDRVAMEPPEIGTVSGQVITAERPQDQLGADGDPWFRLRLGRWSGWCRLPVGWLAWAHRHHGLADDGADPAAPDLDRGVDLAVTSYLLEDTARRLATALESPVEVSGVVPGGVLELPEGDAWFAARVPVAFAGGDWEVCLLWRDDSEPPMPMDWTRDLSFAVSVLGATLELTLGELRALKVGDILLPDAGFEAGTEAEGWGPKVRLVLQDRWREGRWSADGQLDLTAGAWRRTEKGEAMNSEPQVAPVAEEPVDEPFDPQDLEVVLAFELCRLAVPLRELQGWGEGTVLEAGREADEPVEILLRQGHGSRRLGRGRALVIDGRLGIRIDEWLPPAEVSS